MIPNIDFYSGMYYNTIKNIGRGIIEMEQEEIIIESKSNPIWIIVVAIILMSLPIILYIIMSLIYASIIYW